MEEKFKEFSIMINDLIVSSEGIMEKYFDKNGVKEEYKNEQYSELVLIDQLMKNNLEKIGEMKQELKEEKESKMITDYFLLVGDELEEFLKECADFSILFYTLVTDILLCKTGMDESTLDTDVSNIARKYIMLVEELKNFKTRLQVYLKYEFD